MGSERKGRPQQFSRYRAKMGFGGSDFRSKRRHMGLTPAYLLPWMEGRFLLMLGAVKQKWVWGGTLGGDNLWNPQGIWVGGREVFSCSIQKRLEDCVWENRETQSPFFAFVLFFDKEKKLLVEWKFWKEIISMFLCKYFWSGIERWALHSFVCGLWKCGKQNWE